jgi:predicted aspartyl protease
MGMKRYARRALVALLPVLVLLSLTSCGQVLSGLPLASNPQPRTVPLQVVEGPEGSVLALAPVFINGQGPFPFALDTGASVSLIDRELAGQLGLPIAGTPREVTGITGAEEAELVRVDQWQVGEVGLPAAMGVTVNLPEPSRGVGLQGLLGSDILSEFGVITVDYRRGILILGG